MDFRHCNSWLRGLLVCLLYLGLEQGCVNAECNWMSCRDDYNMLKENPAIICLSIQLAEECLARQECPRDENLSILSFTLQLSSDRDHYNCTSQATTTPTTATSPTTPPPTDPPDVNCSLAPMPSNFEVTPMNHAVVIPADPNNDSALPVCTRLKLRAHRQCSLYFHSHLRQWGGQTIQACSLPGSWYLINHPDVTVEVTAESDNAQSSFTRLTKVNITFPKTSCNSFLTHSYVAVVSEVLPTNTTAGSLPTMIDTQVHVNSNRTVASILAPWFNFSAIIRNYGGYLSVVTQFDADEMAAADGLCSTGCPSHAQVNKTAFLQQKCQDDQNQALFSCFIQTANRINNQLFTNLGNEFVTMCQMNLLQLSRYDILSFMQAELNDTNALPDIGIFVTPEPDSAPVPIDPVFVTPETDSTPAPIDPNVIESSATSSTPTPATTNTQSITTSATTRPPTTQPLNTQSSPSDAPGPATTNTQSITTSATTRPPTTQPLNTQSSPSDAPGSNLYSSGPSLHKHFNVLLSLLIVLVISFLYT